MRAIVGVSPVAGGSGVSVPSVSIMLVFTKHSS